MEFIIKLIIMGIIAFLSGFFGAFIKDKWGTNIIIEFIIKLCILSVIAFTLGLFKAFIEIKWRVNMDSFLYCIMGYIGCLIFNWRWFINGRNKEK